MSRDEGPANASRARWVTLGILCSRSAGLVRTKVFAHVLGNGPHKDVLDAAFRIPNLLQNLLGDQAMAAAFIPIYSRLLAEDRREEAGRFAGAIFALLLAVVAAAVGLGVVVAPWLVALFNAGFLGDAAAVASGEAAVDRYPIAVVAARIVFPMTGVLVLSAWAQAILASHRRFLLPYMAPVLWNAAIITVVLLVYRGVVDLPASIGDGPVSWVLAACLGGVVGGFLQFGVQLPLVLRLVRDLRMGWRHRGPLVGEALRAFAPAVAGRGVVQLSLYIDLLLASFLHAGAISALTVAGQLYALPLSAFAMSVAASELPELSRAGPEATSALGDRLSRALRQAAFLIAPAMVGLLVFGLPVVSIFRGGAFARDDQVQVYLVLAGYTLGLLASTTSRLLQNTFYALRDTRTPAKVATARVVVSATVGLALMVLLDRVSVSAWLGVDDASPLFLGAMGLSLGAAFASWIELALLRHALRRRLPGLSLPVAAVARRVLLALALALPAGALWWISKDPFGRTTGILVAAAYAVTYLGFAWLRKSPELAMWLGRGPRHR